MDKPMVEGEDSDSIAKQIVPIIDDAFSRNAYQEALQIALPWAERGHGWAEACVGSLYQVGLGVDLDLERAIHFFERATQHGFAGAWYSLGVIYSVGGDRVRQNPELAQNCYLKAKELGYFLGRPFIYDL